MPITPCGLVVRLGRIYGYVMVYRETHETRFLDFAPVTVYGIGNLTEHRLIALDAGSHLNKCKVWYDGLNSSQTIVAGFPRRDESVAVMDSMTTL